MNVSHLIALLLTFAALTTYLNHRFWRLPTTVALVLSSVGISLLVLLASRLGFDWPQQVQASVQGIDFGAAFLNGMLSFLLFAGSLHVPLDELRVHRWPVAVLATFGVLLSLLLVAGMMYMVFSVVGFAVPWTYCLVFGALISPTDPVAVLEMLRRCRAPRALETGIAGESLFNDGVGVVAFVACFQLLGRGDVAELDWTQLTLLLLQQIVGGLVLGAVLGWITYLLLQGVDEYRVEVLLTLALVSGGYSLATVLGLSGPLAIVAAGLIIGNVARSRVMSRRTRMRLDGFWELIDEILNAVLFVLIGVTVLSLRPTTESIFAGVLAIPVVLAARGMSVGALCTLLWPDRDEPFGRYSIRLLTWGGLRGGIPVALALSLPTGHQRDLLLTVTYVVVVFSVVVQGMTFPSMLRRLFPGPRTSQPPRQDYF